MTEIQKIIQLFDALQKGQCWIGQNMQQVIDNVSAEVAKTTRQHNGNTIWQLVNHIIFWRKTVIIRLQGEDAFPPIQDMFLPEDLSEASWKITLSEFDEVYGSLRNAILSFEENRLHIPSPRNEQTYHDLLMGCLQHDSYHMGQMVFIKKGLTNM